MKRFLDEEDMNNLQGICTNLMSTLDAEAGDSEPDDLLEMSDDELEDYYPILWAMRQVSKITDILTNPTAKTKEIVE